jgi:hypothetical protein
MPDGISLSPYNTRRQHEHADAMERGHILKEYEAFAARVGRAWRISAQAIATASQGHAGAHGLPHALACMEDTFADLFGAEWRDIQNRFDDAGGDPADMPFPAGADAMVSA